MSLSATPMETMWPLKEDLVKEARRRAGRDLTAAERQEYDVPEASAWRDIPWRHHPRGSMNGPGFFPALTAAKERT